MALEVGKDTYATLEEADNYIANLYMPTSQQVIKWNALPEGSKEVLLRASCKAIDYLKFDGEKKQYSQVLQFPRKNRYMAGYGYRLYIGQLYDNGLIDGTSANDGLAFVKEAQVENAVWHAVLGDDMADEQVTLNIKGLVSKRAGSVGEAYNRNTRQSKDISNGIYTPKVYEILKPWLSSSKGVI
jgi:hypothetical protein